MANKVSINLLPPELEQVKQQRVRQSLVSKISIAVLVVMIIAAVAVLFLRLQQTENVKKLDATIASDTDTLNSSTYRSKEGKVMTLNARIGGISTTLNKNYAASVAYGYITQVLPSGVSIKSLDVDAKGALEVVVSSSSTQALGDFFNNLLDPTLGNGKMSALTISSLNENNLGTILVTLDGSLTPKASTSSSGTK